MSLLAHLPIDLVAAALKIGPSMSLTLEGQLKKADGVTTYTLLEEGCYGNCHATLEEFAQGQEERRYYQCELTISMYGSLYVCQFAAITHYCNPDPIKLHGLALSNFDLEELPLKLQEAFGHFAAAISRHSLRYQ